MKTLLIVLTLVEVAILVVIPRSLSDRDRREAAEDLAHARPRHLRRAGDREADRADWARRVGHQLVARAGGGRWNRSSARRTPSRPATASGDAGRGKERADHGDSAARNGRAAPPSDHGVVQGVGFRPFVHGLAARHRLGGFVLNDGRGVVVEARACRSACRLHRRDRRGGSAARPDRRRRSRVDRPGRRAKVPDRAKRGRWRTAALVPPEHCDLRRLPARALRPRRPSSPLSIHQLHPVRPAVHDRRAGSLRPR